MCRYKHSFFSSLLLLINSLLTAQAIEVKQVKKYSQADGLSSYNIRKITQDSKGFMWIGTQDGLNRFDGKEFISYNKNKSKNYALCGSDVKDVLEQKSQHVLWVLSSEAGIDAIDLSTGYVTFTEKLTRENNNQNFNCMLLAGNILWLGSATGIILYDVVSKQIQARIKSLFNSYDSNKPFNVEVLHEDIYGNIWMGIKGNGLIIVNGKTGKMLAHVSAETLDSQPLDEELSILSITGSLSPEILLGTSNGLKKIVFDKEYAISVYKNLSKTFPLINRNRIEAVYRSDNNSTYIALHDNLVKFDNALVSYQIIEEPTNSFQGNWVKAVQKIYVDKENNLWLGCQQGVGFISHKPPPFKSYYYGKTNITRLEHVWSVLPGSNNNIMIGLRNGIGELNCESQTLTIKYENHLFNHLFYDVKKRIWVSRDDGMFIYNNRNLVPIEKQFPEFRPFRGIIVNSEIMIGDSLMILGTENDKGLLIWNYKKRSARQVSSATYPHLMQSDIVNKLFKDNNSNIWVLSDHLITILTSDFKLVKTFSIKDKVSSEDYSLYFDICKANGYYWITSYSNGVLQLDSAYNLISVTNTQNGLNNDGVYQVFNIGDTALLVTTNNGLSHIRIDKSKNKKEFLIKNYFESDGLHSNSFEELSGVQVNGIIYAGGVKGFSIIDPGRFSANSQPPSIFFTRIDVRTNTGSSEFRNINFDLIKIPNTATQASIYLSAINYTNPERTAVLYRIKEIGNNWNRVHPSNIIVLPPLNPGLYTVEVKALNEDGVESGLISKRLEFEPKWYQSTLFYFSVALLLILGVFALYKARINQLRKEHKIRSKLASDLHDDLGSTLNSIKVYANLASLNKNRETYLEEVRNSSQRAITDLRDIIWVMDDKKNSVEHLANRLDQFYQPLCIANGVELKHLISEEAFRYNLRPDEKRSLYMILKEAFNNSIKYSQGNELTLSISIKEDKLNFIVHDNGVGFNLSASSDGNGLNNMKSRASEIKYSINFLADKGTTVQLIKK